MFTHRANPLRCANNRAWRSALKACGIENFRWHDLRHTWASWLRQNDVPTWLLHELGGWKSESMVRRYAHMSVKHLAPYADQLIFPVTAGDIEKPRETVTDKGNKNGHSQSRRGFFWSQVTDKSLRRMVDTLGLEPRTR
ncbi:hypothetical protein BH10PSE12_BH10PSE12_05540 [soil metagenome]